MHNEAQKTEQIKKAFAIGADCFAMVRYLLFQTCPPSSQRCQENVPHALFRRYAFSTG
jgi:hypothetical protein